MTEQHAPKKYEPNAAMKAANSMMRVLARAGLIPKTSVLSVPGRKSGELRSTPVTPIEVGGSVWLVSPYGTVGWVHNVRAAGEVRLSRGRASRRFTTREAVPSEAGPVLKRYVAVAPLVLPYFTAKPDGPAAAFAAEAARHPVFELTMVDEAG